ncbi:hypothetical protein NCTGTJJY_CDS0026 [Serratia phage 92A1]|nr:hypothetical protein NCTGTJJY_CDS0026 [Serratia phage 92A1]
MANVKVKSSAVFKKCDKMGRKVHFCIVRIYVVMG